MHTGVSFDTLPTETKVESGTSHSKSGTSVNLSNSGYRRHRQQPCRTSSGRAAGASGGSPLPCASALPTPTEMSVLLPNNQRQHRTLQIFLGCAALRIVLITAYINHDQHFLDYFILVHILSFEAVPAERQVFIDNLLVRIHFIIMMIRWTGLAP